jgi:hypothetical protein
MTQPDNEPSSPLTADMAFETTSSGWSVSYSDRLAKGHPELVDQSADYLEDDLGVVNLGQIDNSMLLADGPLTDEVRNGLIAWWTERVPNLKTE